MLVKCTGSALYVEKTESKRLNIPIKRLHGVYKRVKWFLCGQMKSNATCAVAFPPLKQGQAFQGSVWEVIGHVVAALLRRKHVWSWQKLFSGKEGFKEMFSSNIVHSNWSWMVLLFSPKPSASVRRTDQPVIFVIWRHTLTSERFHIEGTVVVFHKTRELHFFGLKVVQETEVLWMKRKKGFSFLKTTEFRNWRNWRLEDYSCSRMTEALNSNECFCVQTDVKVLWWLMTNQRQVTGVKL